MYIGELEIIGSGQICFVFHEKTCMKKKTSQREENSGYPQEFRLSVKNTTIKFNKYVVNQKLEYFGDISFRELSGRIKVVDYKIRFVPSYGKVFVFTLTIFVLGETQLD